MGCFVEFGGSSEHEIQEHGHNLPCVGGALRHTQLQMKTGIPRPARERMQWTHVLHFIKANFILGVHLDDVALFAT